MAVPITYAINVLLQNDSDITDIVGTRIGPEINQGWPLPYALIQLVDATHDHHMLGNAALVKPRVQIDWYTKDYPQAWDIAEKARLALDGFTGDVVVAGFGTLTIRMLFLQSEQIIFDDPEDGSGDVVHRLIQDYLAGHAEVVPTF